jgi:pilus assembly protein CpaB
MKPKTMILMVVAVACGLVASYMTSRLLADRNSGQADTMVDVVVAKKKVPPLTLIRKPEDLFEIRSVKEDGPITGKAVKTLEELKDKRVKNTISAEAVLRQDDLQKKEDQTIDIPVGQRAIAIKVTAESSTGGFVLPGMRVDILSTMRRGDEPASLILLQNMLVLAVGEEQMRADGKTTMLAPTVTLAATPQECQQLALAQQQGELRLTLRSTEDKRLVTSAPTKVSDLGKGVRDRNQENGETVPEGSETNPGFVPGLGPVIKDEPPPMPKVEPTVVVKPEPPKVEEPKLVQHTLTVREGASTQQFVFTQHPDSGEWRGGRFSKGNDDAPARKPAANPAPPPAPKNDGTTGENNPASPERKK